MGESCTGEKKMFRILFLLFCNTSGLYYFLGRQDAFYFDLFGTMFNVLGMISDKVLYVL